jgi:hypothetical protein
MSISKEAIASQLLRLQYHADKTFNILNEALLDLFDDETGEPTDEVLYNLLTSAEEGLQQVCRRIDEAAGIASREARR